MAAEAAPLALYIHWPFCLSKCPYCDFNSHVADAIDHDRWRAALLRELDHAADTLPGRTVTSVFFGGGTPSLMAPATAAAMLDRVAQRWSLDDAEITLEANPTSVEAGRLADFRAAGVNRVSLGVQALDDDALKFLGRGHDASEAVAAVELAARLFPRWSIDLIYARPGQGVAAWRAELTRALDLVGDHVSVYQLTIERGTPFFAAHRDGAFHLPGQDDGRALYDETQTVLTEAGLPAYEISNHARPGGESRHNLAYWRYRDYAGIGPGAHGRVTVGGALFATERLRAPEAWLAAVEANGHATRVIEPVAPARRAEEMLMMGLRLNEGVDRAAFGRRAGRSLDAAVSPTATARLAAAGLIEDDATGLRLTAAGRPVLDAILAALIA